MKSPQEPSPSKVLETALHNFAASASRLGLPDPTVRQLRTPKEQIALYVHARMPSGGIRDCMAFLVRHSDVLGPAKGGIRVDARVTQNSIAGLAMEMTWKTALIGVPFGGGKSGIACDPKALTPEDREVLIRAFARAATRHIGPELYVPAPDMGSSEADMGYIRDTISHADGMAITRGCYVTGKPVILGGVLGRRDATGMGVTFALESACRHLGCALDGLRVAIQGFGNVGSVAARELHARGARIVAVADLGGGVADPQGLDIPALIAHAEASGMIAGFSGGCGLDPSEIFSTECDVLLPAASGSQLHGGNAGAVRARIVAEGANAPTTPEADQLLQDAGVFVIPDILCNAGGVFVSYLEYTQETQREQMTLEEVTSRLEARMESTFAEVLERAKAGSLPMRSAAMDIAVSRVVNGLHARGTQP